MFRAIAPVLAQALCRSDVRLSMTAHQPLEVAISQRTGAVGPASGKHACVAFPCSLLRNIFCLLDHLSVSIYDSVAVENLIHFSVVTRRYGIRFFPDPHFFLNYPQKSTIHRPDVDDFWAESASRARSYDRYSGTRCDWSHVSYSMGIKIV